MGALILTSAAPGFARSLIPFLFVFTAGVWAFSQLLLRVTSLFKTQLSDSIRFCRVQPFWKWRPHLPSWPPKKGLNNPGGLWWLRFLQLSRDTFCFQLPKISKRLSNWSPYPAGVRDKAPTSVSRDWIAVHASVRITCGKCHVWSVTPNSHKSLLCRNTKNYPVSIM